MKYSQFISYKNLDLAWRRITTAKNLQYKRFFRPLYLAYEVGLENNLKQLNERLQGGWKASPPLRVYYPKPSGLQRPISILSLEDQIVLQAIGNIFSKKFSKRREAVEKTVVYSNCLNHGHDSIFFLDDWHRTYELFQKRIEKYYKKGFRWIAHFDLAAYYDTISHELLINLASPRGGNKSTWDFVRKCFACWSATSQDRSFHHSIPQGPIASDFLAECLLLPVDEAMRKKKIPYIRYVDDIRIFAKTELDAQKAAIELEILCRNMGLIPQGQKFGIKKAKSMEDAYGMLPSIAPPGEAPGASALHLTLTDAEECFESSLSGRPYRITEKSRARYALYRSPKSKKIINWVTLLLSRHPEHIDAFSAFLSLYSKSKPLEKKIKQLIKDDVPYGYVRGELWHILARISDHATKVEMLPYAQDDLKKNESGITLKWGSFIFLLACQNEGLGRFSNKTLRLPPLVQALIVPSLPDSEYKVSGVVKKLLKSKNYEPGVMLAEQLVNRKMNHRAFGLKVNDLSSTVQNVFRPLGIIQRRSGHSVDQIGEILAERYGVDIFRKWKVVFGDEYVHALQILLQADAVFKVAPSQWLQQQNSFNDALFRALQLFLFGKKAPEAFSTKNKHGKLIDFGVLLEPTGKFSKKYPVLTDGFRAANVRRNSLPPSHPYDKKSGRRNKFLGRSEQGQLVNELSKAYSELITLAENIL